MKQFAGLLKKEHKMFSSLITFLGVAAIAGYVCLPIAFHRYNAKYTIEDFRFVIITIAMASVVVIALCAFLASLRTDIKNKEIWLHSTSRMTTLVGVKFIYQLVGLVLLITIAFSGLFFVENIVSGTFTQFIWLYMYTIYFVVALFTLLFIITLMFYALGVQAKHVLGKWAFIVITLALLLFLNLIRRLPDTLLPYGHIPMDWSTAKFPTFYGEVTPAFIVEIYIAEELFTICLLVLVYIVCCKWIERVITR